MKTPIKIVLLVLFSIGAVAGIFVYAKTRVSPPVDTEMIDQYAPVLAAETEKLGSITDFAAMRSAYIMMDDKVARYRHEKVIDNAASDVYRVRIDSIYGKSLLDFGYSRFKTSKWKYDDINYALELLDELLADRLTNGKAAVSSDFIAGAADIKGIVDDYHAAVRLTKRTGYSSVNDASDKIRQARNYAAHRYLKNNAALLNDLNAMPERLANSHYNYVSGLVNSLYNYASMTKDDYMRSVERVDKAINEYKGTSVYGSKKKGVDDLSRSAARIVNDAMVYYENKKG